MRHAGIRKGSKPHHILKTVLACGGILLLGSISPASGAVLARNLLQLYFRNKRMGKERFLQDLKRLQNRKLIDYIHLPDGKVKITLTARGKNKVLMYNFDEMRLKTHGWDGKWRMIIFDIPDRQKRAREALRQKMREMDFYPLQKSVFITPYPCEDEIDFICGIFEINRNNVLLLEISRFEGSEKLKRHFRL